MAAVRRRRQPGQPRGDGTATARRQRPGRPHGDGAATTARASSTPGPPRRPRRRASSISRPGAAPRCRRLRSRSSGRTGMSSPPLAESAVSTTRAAEFRRRGAGGGARAAPGRDPFREGRRYPAAGPDAPPRCTGYSGAWRAPPCRRRSGLTPGATSRGSRRSLARSGAASASRRSPSTRSRRRRRPPWTRPTSSRSRVTPIHRR